MLKGNARSLNKLMRLHSLNYILSLFIISGLSLLFGDVDVFFLNQSSDHFLTDAVVSSSDHCRTETVLPPSDHYCIETVASSGDHSFKIFIHSNHLPWYIEDHKISINS